MAAPTITKLMKATVRYDKYLDKLTRKQQVALVAAIKKLEKRIVGLMDKLEREGGRLVSTKVNLVQAQELHAQIGAAMEQIYGGALSRYVSRDMGRITKRSAKYLGTLTGEPQKFIGIDKRYITQLAKADLQQFRALGTQAVDDVGKALYEHLMGGESFNRLKQVVRGTLTGHKSITGRAMTSYARQMSFDTVRNFSNQVTLYKAEKIGLDQVIYYGDVIETSREFCRRNAGKVMTQADIRRLDKQRWDGKSGPFKTHRGGFNCRHSFLPIKKEWVKGKTTEVQDFNKEYF